MELQFLYLSLIGWDTVSWSGCVSTALEQIRTRFPSPQNNAHQLLKNIVAGHESIKQTRNTKPSLRYGWWNLTSCFVTHPCFYKVSIDAKWFFEFLSSTVSPQTFSVQTTSAVSETAVPSNRIPSNNTGIACESMMVHAAVKAKSNLSQIKGRGQTSIDILPLQEVVHLQMVQVPLCCLQFLECITASWKYPTKLKRNGQLFNLNVYVPWLKKKSAAFSKSAIFI